MKNGIRPDRDVIFKVGHSVSIFIDNLAVLIDGHGSPGGVIACISDKGAIYGFEFGGERIVLGDRTVTEGS